MRQITGNIQLTSAMSGPMAALGTLSAARMAGLMGRPGPVQPAGPGAGGATRGPAPAGGGSAAAGANARMARSARLAGRWAWNWRPSAWGGSWSRVSCVP